MNTPKDFEFLSESIFGKLHENVSATTLKRIWGYLPTDSMPRESTLDMLARFIGYSGWEAFCKKEAALPSDPAESVAPETPAPSPTPSNVRRWKVVSAIAIAGIILMAALLLFFVLSARHGAGTAAEGQAEDSIHIIKVGQHFGSELEYLHRFGILADSYKWGQVIPHHPNISVWGPQYHHPEWHNEGDTARMMPTITEWWKPAVVKDSTAMAMLNLDRYLQYRRMNELRITFMKDLVDTGYIFLGVYRLSLTHSDTARCVWERVADEVDLRDLDRLELLR